MKRAIALVLVCLFAFDFVAFAGLGSDKTAYIGGTENQIKEGTEGKSSAKDDKHFEFEYKGGTLTIPYDQVDDLEYGQKAGRRLGLALAISPWLLLSHKRKHFLTIGWKDEQDKAARRGTRVGQVSRQDNNCYLGSKNWQEGRLPR